jgi:hypothetical protein
MGIGGSNSYGDIHVNGCLWYIEWDDCGILDDPNNITIWIDGNTGEVIYVH